MNKTHVIKLLGEACKSNVYFIETYIETLYNEAVDDALQGKRRQYPDMDVLTEEVLLTIAETVPTVLTLEYLVYTTNRLGATVLNENILRTMAINEIADIESGSPFTRQATWNDAKSSEMMCAITKIILQKDPNEIKNIQDLLLNKNYFTKYPAFRKDLFLRYIGSIDDIDTNPLPSWALAIYMEHKDGILANEEYLKDQPEQKGGWFRRKK